MLDRFFLSFVQGINDTYDTGIKYIYVTLKSQTSKYDFKYINSTELFMHITRFEADGLAYFYVPQTFFRGHDIDATFITIFTQHYDNNGIIEMQSIKE